jgi:hypothetical protein
MKSFEQRGVWWTPADPRRQRVGTLHFDPLDGATLKLIVPAEKPDLFPELESYELLFGLTTDGKAITLVRCHDRSSTGTLGKTPRPLEIFANEVIVGSHCTVSDPLLSSVFATYRHLNEWYGRSGMSVDSAVKPPDWAARYSSADPVIVHDDGRFRLSIRSRMSGSFGRHRARMRERIRIEIEAVTPTPLSEFRQLVHACGDFLSIACFALSNTRTMILEFPATDTTPKHSASFHAVPIYKNRASRAWQGAHMLFHYSDIEDRAQAIFGAWLSQREKLHAARALYFAGVYGGGFVETKLLALTQAAEAFHRRFHPPGVFMDPARFQAEVLKPLKAAIPACVDSSFRQSLRDRLKFANEHSLRRRMNDLVDEHAEALKALVESPKDWVSPIVDHRNEFTHFPTEIEPNAERPERPDPERILRYNFVLRLLLEACFLKAMGFSPKESAGFTTGCDTYRQLSVGFFRRQPQG